MSTQVDIPYNPKKFSIRQRISKALRDINFSHFRRRSWQTKFAIFLVFASVLSCCLTYVAMTEGPPFGNNPSLVIWLLNIDLVLLLLLVSLIARRIVSVWSGRKRGIAGSHLHIRFVYIFSILVAVPTIIMTVFSAMFFHFGIQAWFSQRVQTAINESQAVAQSYLEEHKEVIRADTMAMANDLSRQSEYLLPSAENFSKALETQSFFRNLSEAIVINAKGHVLARSALAFSLEYELPRDYAFTQTGAAGDVVLFMNDEQDRVRALVKLNNFDDAYLFVGRMIDPQVLQHLKAAKLATEDYKNLQSQYAGMQITVTLLFIVVGLLLLLAAIWSGLLIARELVNPIGELIKAADRVRAGDLGSRLSSDIKRLEEFDYLATAFNRMTEQLQSQRSELIEANRQIDRRRHLIEIVLLGVSSGVIGVDKDGKINLANNSAAQLLSKPAEDIADQYILDVFPELSVLLNKISDRKLKTVQGELLVSSPTGKRTFLFRISVEQLEDQNAGLIITFDDITELQSAQRKAAWSDVARRIAHEIKNPLTPIQLSAERLSRKYLKQIETDPETFEKCTETIIKHVTDIGRMVDEFSSFARMPEPVLRAENLYKQIEESLFLMRQAHTDIQFNLYSNEKDVLADIDSRQIRQVITNLIQNSIDSIHEKKSKGIVDILVGKQEGGKTVFVAIGDNGAGFPENEDVSKLTEPYITHKAKGTGLGLAIVKKIMDDHGGTITLGHAPFLDANKNWVNRGGACVLLTLPPAAEI